MAERQEKRVEIELDLSIWAFGILLFVAVVLAHAVDKWDGSVGCGCEAHATEETDEGGEP